MVDRRRWRGCLFDENVIKWPMITFVCSSTITCRSRLLHRTTDLLLLYQFLRPIARPSLRCHTNRT